MRLPRAFLDSLLRGRRVYGTYPITHCATDGKTFSFRPDFKSSLVHGPGVARAGARSTGDKFLAAPRASS